MTDKPSPENRGEPLTLMEPMRLAKGARDREKLSDLALELAARSAAFRRSLPEAVYRALSDLVRSMNCYYSNLIEGHNTHPVDIERALRSDYSHSPEKRNLQLEARAHIEVQRWIDTGSLKGRSFRADTIVEVHARFHAAVPEELLWVTNPDTEERAKVAPGQLRTRDVKIGQLVAVSPGAVPRFLSRYESVYSGLGKLETLLAAAAAHHRLLWIHPFLDGNGRVARLLSHASLLETLDTGGVWSIARGLARNVSAYKGHLMACDQPRRNDLDGRGSLSEEALVAFTEFFLETCLDQVRFMEDLTQPATLRNRILRWTAEEIHEGRLPANADRVMEALLYRGALPRSEVPTITATSDRQARRIIAALGDAGVVVSDTSRAPLRIGFPARLAPRWMPGLFPENP